MQNNLVLNPHTKRAYELYVKNPSQGVILLGSNGVGKSSLAFALAKDLLELPKSKELQNHPYFLYITRQNNKKDIAIEQIRELIHILKLKAPGTNSIRRVVFIEDAQYLSIPAQNALLKILEEPNSDTAFILSATSVQSVLPTIASRTQHLEINPISLKEAKSFWKEYPEQTIESAWKLSKGAPGLLNALLNGEEHPLKSAVDDIKIFLRANKFERIISIDKISKDRENFAYFLDALSRTLTVLHHQAINNNKVRQSKAILNSRKLVNDTIKALSENANSRLAALNLALSIEV